MLSQCTLQNTGWLSFRGQSIDAKVLDVYDGDTITVALPLNKTFYKVKCRLMGINTPEIRTKDPVEKKAGYEAKEWLCSAVLNELVVLKCGKWDKYGRLLCTVIKNSGEVINQSMISNGLAVKYTGKAKKKIKRNISKSEISDVSKDTQSEEKAGIDQTSTLNCRNSTTEQIPTSVCGKAHYRQSEPEAM